MALEVLQNESQIKAAREVMLDRDISFTDSLPSALLKRAGLKSGLSIGDSLKSWDVLRTVSFIEQELPKNAAVLDIGCFCSELLLCLHDLGYTNLTGSDLNADIADMPYSSDIEYRQEDFLKTSLPENSFDAITSISVLEHGFNSTVFLGEMSRLLKPGGYLLSSFDYWPDKIDTGDTTFFGMSWTLFSRDEILQFVEDASSYGLTPVGNLAAEAADRPIKCAGFDYTFGWLALQKPA